MAAAREYLLSPRRTLDRAVTSPGAGRATRVVVASAAVYTILSAITTLLTATGPSLAAGFVGAVIVGLLLVAFWYLAASMIDRTVVRTQTGPSRRRELLAASARGYPVLVLLALLDVVEAIALHGGQPAVASALGWLALPLLVWYMGMQIGAVMAAYRVPFFSGFALATLPYAATAIAMMLLVMVLSTIGGAGMVVTPGGVL